mmetsp:Transcript_140193/g.435998  ORF Transcript_140193/g.435998 Transcript_140193/m.435998 type:complete len:247 (+) Transcript_140193:1-741(+)
MHSSLQCHRATWRRPSLPTVRPQVLARRSAGGRLRYFQLCRRAALRFTSSTTAWLPGRARRPASGSGVSRALTQCRRAAMRLTSSPAVRPVLANSLAVRRPATMWLSAPVRRPAGGSVLSRSRSSCRKAVFRLPSLCGAGVGACEKAGQRHCAFARFAATPRTRITPAVVSYAAAVSVCERAGHGLRVAVFFVAMPQSRLAPVAVTYREASSACEKAGQRRRALAILAAMPTNRLGLDVVSYSAVV